jgi:CRP/FNR family cyclic AMP-dependent transcriptional regulator
MLDRVKDRGVSESWSPGTLLHALCSADRRSLVTLGARRAFHPGQALIVEGSTDADTFVLLDGCAKVLCNTADGRAVLLSVRVAGDLVGELAALDDKPRSASVVAATEIVAQAVPQPAFQLYLTQRPQAARAVHRAVVEDLRRATRYRVTVTGAPTAVRLALMLEYLATAYGRRCAEGIRIDIPLSQLELASLVGVSEPSLHRALSDLRGRDVVRTRYRRLIVCDLAALRVLTNG